MTVDVVSFYRFCELSAPEILAARLRERAMYLELHGTVLLGEEGINATLAGRQPALGRFLELLDSEISLETVNIRWTRADRLPFRRLKVRVKPEIVALGIDGVSPLAGSGKHVSPSQWNDLASSADVLLLDTRNAYEVRIGTFTGARNPQIDNFREFPSAVSELAIPKDQPIAMFCTGGIRCEKASAYMLEQGFLEVYQLHGGILAYLETMRGAESLWQGDCFMFDDRVAIGADLAPSEYELCPGCRGPVGAAERAAPGYISGVCCPHCHEYRDASQRSAAEERRRQIELAERVGRVHLGAQESGDSGEPPQPSER